VVWFAGTPKDQYVLEGRVSDRDLRAPIPRDVLARVGDDQLWGDAIFLGICVTESGAQPRSRSTSSALRVDEDRPRVPVGTRTSVSGSTTPSLG
jgi:hypothetical protein